MALSYYWGASTQNRKVLVDNITWDVTDNLYMALVLLKELAGDVSIHIWTNQLCINQKNKVETKDHVKLMGNIYGRAEAVLMWLREGTSKSNNVLNHFIKCNKYGMRLH